MVEVGARGRREKRAYTQLKNGVQGGHVAHRGETEVKVVQKEESGDWTRRKTKKQQKTVEEKKHFWSLVPHENRPTSRTKKSLRVLLRTPCTSGKGLHGHKRSTYVMYRNIVSTRVCANTFFSVVQNGSAVLPEHYRAREGN